ncbi:MAG: ABC transporter ATP-binding protein [Alphaproteobacteria bacterium]|nr:ABC transporter ATP-binding protein [Alphaproteobacteria bacterium]
MAGLRLEGLTKRFGEIAAVDHVDLDLPPQKLVCLLGPSGCGKTTLLRLIAGLETATEGRILLDGADLTGVSAHDRDFGMVFQSLALFPHLTVGENIAYALKIRGVDKATRDRRVAELLDLVQLPGVGERRISQLSGGQRQRVAIARALAIDPKLFLLDEPLSALDAKLREKMQVELRLLQQRLAVTTIVVTHDQREAMTMADIVVVMNEGRVLQAGPPLEIYRNPADTFVADFIGISNLIPCEIVEAGTVEVAGHRLALADMPSGLAEERGAATLSVRPEDLHVLPVAQGQADGLRGTVAFIRDLGASVEISLDCAGQELVAVTTPKERPAVSVGDTAGIEIPGDRAVVLRG